MHLTLGTMPPKFGGTGLVPATSLLGLVLKSGLAGCRGWIWNGIGLRKHVHTNIVGIKVQYASAERPKGVVFNNL